MDRKNNRKLNNYESFLYTGRDLNELESEMLEFKQHQIREMNSKIQVTSKPKEDEI